MKKAAKALVAELEDLGFQFDRVNSKAKHVYVHDAHPDLALNLGVDEHSARNLLRKVRRHLGCEEEVTKRQPEQVKARQATERERATKELDQLAVQRVDALAKKESHLGGYGKQMTARQARAVEREIERIDRETRRWTALMTETPASGVHRGNGRVRHEAGQAS